MTINKHMVGMQGGRIVIHLPPREPMEKEDALIFAAWIIALADPIGDRFKEILDTIQSI